MGFRVLGRGGFGDGKRLGWGNKQTETTFGGISTKKSTERNPTQVLPTCSPGPLSEDAAVGHSTDRCRVPWRVTVTYEW